MVLKRERSSKAVGPEALSGTASKWLSWPALLGAASIIRLTLLLFAEWQDRNMALKYTDIDYVVYTDAARFVVEGGSPYDRATYRYSPLLAYILIPNVTLHPLFGKVVFASFDLLAGAFIYAILKTYNKDDETGYMCTSFWLLNPFVINMSTRGSFETLSCTIVLGTVLACLHRRLDTAALLFGLAVHLRIYPIMYILPFLLHICCRENASKPSLRGVLASLTRQPILVSCLRFCVISGGLCVGLCIFFYHMYGYVFLQETYFYHITRQDTRHNFSVYFYYLYLQGQQQILHPLLVPFQSLLSFLPQFVVVIAIAIKFANDLTFAIFAQTLAFVAFNKVVTAQYFIWYMSLLPLVLPFTKLALRWDGLKLAAAFLCAEVGWGLAAYQIEFNGNSAFLMVWVAGIVFFGTQMWVLVQFMHNHKSAGPLVRTLHNKAS